MKYFLGAWLFAAIAIVSIFGFRGQESRREPLYVFPDMDWQARYKPQGENDFFGDRRNDRPVIAGTRERGYQWDVKDVFSEDYEAAFAQNPALFSGKNDSGEFYQGFPVPVDMELMQLGKERYDIFCLVCHGETGDGNGITKQYGMNTTASFHSDRLRVMPEGEIFEVITNGRNTMYPYGDKLNPQERWAVIAYVRALQTAQNAPAEAVPQTQKEGLGL